MRLTVFSEPAVDFVSCKSTLARRHFLFRCEILVAFMRLASFPATVTPFY